MGPFNATQLPENEIPDWERQNYTSNSESNMYVTRNATPLDNGNVTSFNGTGTQWNQTYTDNYYDYYDYYNYSTGNHSDNHSDNYSYPYYDGVYYTIHPFERYGFGYVWPALVLFTVIANIFVIAFFLLRRNRGKPTNLLFVSIAFSDSMMGIVMLPMAIYVYAMYNDILSEEWCRAIMILRFYVSRVFHTVSVWQTLLLGLQRYMCVCHPFIPSHWCNFKRTLITIAVMYLLALGLHSYHLVNDKVGFDSCNWEFEDGECTATCIYIWMCVAFLHLLPCMLLIFLTARTLLGLSEAKRRVNKMATGSNTKRSIRDRQITMTVTLIVIVFLIPELPQGIYKLYLAISIRMNEFPDPVMNQAVFMSYEILLVLSFHANFWIYCFMIHDFRTALVKLFSTSTLSRRFTRLRSLSSRSSIRSRKTRSTSASSNKTRIGSLHSTSESNHFMMAVSPSIKDSTTSPFIKIFPASDKCKCTEKDDDVFI